MNQGQTASSRDKRHYFRIDDVAVVQYRLITGDEFANTEIRQEQKAFSRLTMMAHFDSMSRELQPMLNVIGNTSANAARCIEILDKKINMIGEYLLSSELAQIKVEPQTINLGAGGVSFCVPGAMMAGAMLEIRLVLLPEQIGIFSYARVTRCVNLGEDANGECRYRISVEFLDMDEDVRDVITRHVLQRERQMMMQSNGGQ